MLIRSQIESGKVEYVSQIGGIQISSDSCFFLFSISQASLKRAKDIFRGHMSVYMTLLAIVGCIFMMRSGRKARDAGESLDRRAIEWQRSVREQGIKEEEEAERQAVAK